MTYQPSKPEVVLAEMQKRTRREMMLMARSHTPAALDKLVDLMNGKAGFIVALNKDGRKVKVAIEVPASVQAKCAELLIDRAYGKAPQALLIGDDRSAFGGEEGARQLTIAEKILAIKAARAGPETTDLEASEVREVEVAQSGVELGRPKGMRVKDWEDLRDSTPEDLAAYPINKGQTEEIIYITPELLPELRSLPAPREYVGYPSCPDDTRPMPTPTPQGPLSRWEKAKPTPAPTPNDFI